jgi:hypothetical protein
MSGFADFGTKAKTKIMIDKMVQDTTCKLPCNLHKDSNMHLKMENLMFQLCLALSQMAKEAKSASPKPQQNENPKYAMRT